MAVSANKPSRATETYSDQDLPLRDDIRLLGRLLGETILDQEGQAIFDLVERMRLLSVRFHRDNDHAARRKLEALLKGLSPITSAARVLIRWPVPRPVPVRWRTP
jgi:phosphoenolpyruvate carboxylase